MLRLPGRRALYGVCRPTIFATVADMFERVGDETSESERTRILEEATSMQPDISSLGVPVSVDQIYGEAPLRSSSVTGVTSVKIVHQIYGMFRDGKPMSSTFEKSREAWMKVSETMGVEYHLWNADEVDTLVKHRYPEFWDMYLDVRYPVQRCDIGRVCIVHAYGGLYADLNTMPNRSWYEEVPLAVQRVPEPRANKRHLERVTGDVHKYVDMEVIVAKRGNDKLIEWLRHMATEVDAKSWTNPSRRNCIYIPTCSMNL